VSLDLKEAQAHRVPTVFEWLTEIIRDHGPGGRQAADGVDLLLLTSLAPWVPPPT
jgi:hypothetical protein